ncbi:MULTISPECIES: iron-containing alcohol dehydrogenase [Leuconostoc]|uniref:NADH-dependent butanol dehydrogenase, putative n=2 Tax=Leuconostoc kimchii TaxID=136609 RepID=D5T087_LEUKI|nr:MULTISPECIES: iron-containing alcohol dehydrogenase [Leuconostoc]ADG39686.1 NADH-dependent butanol dehydrogenase, putative [Leuconostoc kimchii IMSNU 11154]AEJ30453.1 NADH-dependent butanol dehydrogenase, putative [Leuconostoc sp. C2]QBR47513.1 iron-containing alcohol dehydrogenase [Leuconostoc kimchii]
MENFSFKNTTDIRFGADRIDNELRDAVSQFGKNVLLTYGGGSIKKSGLYERVIEALDGLHVVELTGIAPNPKIESVREGQQLVKSQNIDVILAVGGGSVIDASKVIASSKFYDSDPWELVVDSSKRLTIDQLPVVDILTLSATGTEMNQGSVISNPETNQKLGTYGPNTPAISFLDPTLTYSVSKWQTAAGSIDIFSHLAEQYFDQSKNNDVKSGLIEGLMRTVIKWAPVALETPDNYDARANLMWASTMALNGLAHTGNVNGWTVHPIEHELSAYYDITHGIGLGILTPHWMTFALHADTQTQFADFGRHVWQLSGDDQIVATQAIRATADWIASLGVPTTLPGVDINQTTHFEAMAKSAVTVGQLDKAYVPLTTADVIALYEASMK